MKKLILLMAIIFGGCLDETLPELGYNLMDDESIELFELVSVEYTDYSNTHKNVSINFKSIYSELNADQQNEIDKIQVSGSTVASPAADATFFGHWMVPNGKSVCYKLKFEFENEELSRESKFCFDVEE